MYGVTLALLLVRIQTTIVSRYMLLNIQLQNDRQPSTTFQLSVDTQRRFFALRDYLLQSGMPLLVCHIRRAVKESTKSYGARAALCSKRAMTPC